MITLRRSLPEGSHLMVAKNTLLRKAVAGTKFEPMAQATTGMNAWLFVDENVAPTMKAINGLQKGWEKAGSKLVSTVRAWMVNSFRRRLSLRSKTCRPSST